MVFPFMKFISEEKVYISPQRVAASQSSVYLKLLDEKGKYFRPECIMWGHSYTYKKVSLLKGGLICCEQSIELKHKWRCQSKGTICADSDKTFQKWKDVSRTFCHRAYRFLLNRFSQGWIKTYSITSSTLWGGSSFSRAYDQLHQQRCFHVHDLIKPPWLHVQTGLDGQPSSTLLVWWQVNSKLV